MTKGDLIARIGSGPEDPHLHFELRIVLDRSDRRYWSDRSSVALDPTRPLYRFEAGALPLVSSGGPAAVTHLGIQVEVEYRDSVFFAGNRVPASVVLA